MLLHRNMIWEYYHASTCKVLQECLLKYLKISMCTAQAIGIQVIPQRELEATLTRNRDIQMKTPNWMHL